MIGLVVLLSCPPWDTLVVRQAPASCSLLTRVPLYGAILVQDRDGEPTSAESTLATSGIFERISEGSKARAQWRFPGERFSAGCQRKFESRAHCRLQSYKGDAARQLYYDIKFINIDTNLTHTMDPESLNENRKKLDLIPRKITTVDGVQHDLIKDFVSKDGHLYVEVSCVDREQYIGMARSDLYIRMPDRPFLTGYAKAVLGIAFTIVLVAMIGVAASTIVKGPCHNSDVRFLSAFRKTHIFMDSLVTSEFKAAVLGSVYRLFLIWAPPPIAGEPGV